MSVLIKGAKAFIEGEFVDKNIVIEEGKISKIGSFSNENFDEYLNFSDFLILPGLIDPHVHLREPGDTYKEDFVSGSKAAVSGGFTTVMDMPNNATPTITKQRLDEKIELSKKALCSILFHFGGTETNFDEVKKANPSSMKLYLGKSTGTLTIRDFNLVDRHFKEFPKDRPIVLHAWDHTHGGKNDDGNEKNNESENLQQTYEIVEKSITLAAKYNRRVHLAHASTEKEIQIAKKYPKATVEVAPHHLLLSTKDNDRLGYMARVFPTLRNEEERKKLWKEMNTSNVDAIATDHAPHTIEDKKNGAGGFPGLETSFGLMWNAAEKRLIDKKWLINRMSENVAEIFNISKKGKIKTGFDADITIVDPKKEWTVKSEEFFSKSKWSPYDGWKLKGKVVCVIRNGEIIYQQGEFI